MIKKYVLIFRDKLRVEESLLMKFFSLRKQCWIDSSIVGFRSAIKKFGIERYKSNCGPATEGLQLVVENRMKAEQENQNLHSSKSSEPSPVSSNLSSSFSIYKAVNRWQCEAKES